MDIENLAKVVFEGGHSISTDSRTVQPNDVYIGLKGENFDGNAFAKDVLKKGARLAIIDNPQYAIDERCIVVQDSYETLRRLATIYRNTFSIPILVIGGSNGKTTTKELVHEVLSKKYKVHTTKGNLNNEIGVPLTLLAMPKDTETAVIEIGANHPGEHVRIMNTVCPTHVLVTNNGEDHLAGFGTIEGVRKANKEIYDVARSLQATAFINKNLPDLVADSTGLDCVLYPEEYAVKSTSDLYAGLLYHDTPITSHLFGSFNEANMLAAIAIGKQFAVPMSDIAKAIADYEPMLKRSQIIEKDNHTLIVDCYNANPTSMELSLCDFFKTSKAGERVIVIGDMLEVGDSEYRAHGKILALVAEQAGADDYVICAGPRFSSHAADYPDFHFFASSVEAKPYFDTLPLSGKKVFLKASRGIQLEKILANNTL